MDFVKIRHFIVSIYVTLLIVHVLHNQDTDLGDILYVDGRYWMLGARNPVLPSVRSHELAISA